MLVSFCIEAIFSLDRMSGVTLKHLRAHQPWQQVFRSDLC
jgi:hypothetical protein